VAIVAKAATNILIVNGAYTVVAKNIIFDVGTTTDGFRQSSHLDGLTNVPLATPQLRRHEHLCYVQSVSDDDASFTLTGSDPCFALWHQQGVSPQAGLGLRSTRSGSDSGVDV
jgi:hypothetical protein